MTQMKYRSLSAALLLVLLMGSALRSQVRSGVQASAPSIPVAGSKSQPPGAKSITEADCTASKLGTDIPVTAIGEPISRVTLKPPVWTAASNADPAYCSVDGSMAPVDSSATA